MKSIIQTAGLFNTGRLYNSIIVSIDVRDKLIINIQCQPYFVYLDNEYRLVQKFSNNPLFALELEKIYEVIFEEWLQKLVNEKAIDFELPLPVLTINGR